MGNLASLFRLSGQWRHILRQMERGKVNLSELELTKSRDILADYDLEDLGEQPNILMALVLRDFADAGGKADVAFLKYLASMFEGQAPMRAEVVRPKGGKPKRYDSWEIALDVETRLKAGDKPYIAQEGAAVKFGCSKKTVQRAHLAYLEAVDPDEDTQ